MTSPTLFTTVFGVILLALGVGLVALWLQRRRAAQLSIEERDRRTRDLARQANAGLVSVDDRIRNADQEVGFVQAEFGDDEAAPLQAAVATAREELRAAYVVRQQLDDDQPEDPPARIPVPGTNDPDCRFSQSTAIVSVEEERFIVKSPPKGW